MTKLLENDTILLRALEPDDLELLYRWENDTELWKFGAGMAPFSRFALRQYIIDAQQDIYHTKQLRLMVVRKTDGVCVGTVDLYDFDAFNGKAGVGILIDTDHQQKGYGVSALALLEEYAFGFLKLHQLYALVPEENAGSVKLFAKAGFRRTATLNEWLSSGKNYRDVVVMQKFGI